MSLDAYLIFLFATMVVVFSPGPAAITVATQGASQGFKKSFFGTAGVAGANVVYFLLSATGIASLILASNFVFSVIKWVGVVYLIYLGINAIVSRSGGLSISSDTTQTKSNSSLFSQGFIVELANPKALLYFSSLLPQFIDLDKPILIQLFIMGASCLIVDLIAYSTYGYFGHRIAQGGVKPALVNIINRAAGGFLIFAGLRMALIEK
ncbi:LysE family translocator [Alteromonadaceae bacterium M269]|nr:LysE family translocator [Alteromonadaceae bacterium M269]